jgi:hypothetical protein
MAHTSLREFFNAHRRGLAAIAPAWNLSPAAVFGEIVRADPSDDPVYGRNKKVYLDWLLRQTTAGKLQREDLQRTNWALRLHISRPDAPPLHTLTDTNTLTDEVGKMLIGFWRVARMGGPLLESWQRVPRMPDDKTQFPAFAVQTVFEADPTRGRHVEHIYRWLNNLHVLPEDLPRVREDLTLYQANRHRITPAALRDLSSCKDALELAARVNRFRPKGEQLDRSVLEDEALEKNLAKLVADTPDYRLIHVTTQPGAQWLGRDTRWCTSWGNGDSRTCHFPTYSENLLYLRDKKTDAVYQFHFGKWMHNDAMDVPIPHFAKFVAGYPGLTEQLRPFYAKCFTHQKALEKLCESHCTASAARTASLFESLSLLDPENRHGYVTAIRSYVKSGMDVAANNGEPHSVAEFLEGYSPYPFMEATLHRAAAKAIPLALANNHQNMIEFCGSDRVRSQRYKREARALLDFCAQNTDFAPYAAKWLDRPSGQPKPTP